jgi:hypothetical protein
MSNLTQTSALVKQSELLKREKFLRERMLQLEAKGNKIDAQRVRVDLMDVRKQLGKDANGLPAQVATPLALGKGIGVAASKPATPAQPGRPRYMYIEDVPRDVVDAVKVKFGQDPIRWPKGFRDAYHRSTNRDPGEAFAAERQDYAGSFGTGNVPQTNGTWNVAKGKEQWDLFKKTNELTLKRLGRINAEGVKAANEAEELRNATNFKTEETKQVFRKFVAPVVGFGLTFSPLNTLPQFRKAHSQLKDGATDFISGTLASLAPNNYVDNLAAELVTIFHPDEPFDHKWRAAFNFIAEVAGTEVGGKAIGKGAKALVGEVFDLARYSSRLSPQEAEKIKRLLSSVEAAKSQGRAGVKKAFQQAGIQGKALENAMRKFDVAKKNAKAAPASSGNATHGVGGEAFDYTSGQKDPILKTRTFLEDPNKQYREHGNVYASSGKGKVEIDKALHSIRGSVFGKSQPDFKSARKLIDSMPDRYLDEVMLRVVDDLSELEGNSVQFVLGYFNPRAEIKHIGGAGIDVPSIRIGVKRLLDEGKSFTEILAHEVGHQMQDFFTDADKVIIAKAFLNKTEKLRKSVDSGRGTRGARTLHNRLTNASEWWSEAIQDHERLYTFLRTAQKSEDVHLKRLGYKVQYAFEWTRHQVRMAMDKDFRNTVSLYKDMKGRK